MIASAASLDLCLKATALVAMLACAGCEREQRMLEVPPFQATTVGSAKDIPSDPPSTPASLSLAKTFENNSYAIGQGKHLFAAYNCTGCHAQGGGGSGPALMDDQWLYGAEPQDVFSSIVHGRPNGMPSFGSRIPEYQVWQLVAYVRSMTGLTSANATPGRNDAMQAKPSEQLADHQPPHASVNFNSRPGQ